MWLSGRGPEAKAFFAAAKTNISGEVFNVGTGTPQTVVTLAKLIGGKVTKIPDRPGEPRVSKADIRKIKTKLRWKPQIQFKQGIENMLKDIKKWKNAPLWTPSKIKKVTAEWFSYLK